ERIHRHLDVGGLDPAAIRFDPDLDVEIDHALDGHQNLHRSIQDITEMRRPGLGLAGGRRQNTWKPAASHPLISGRWPAGADAHAAPGKRLFGPKTWIACGIFRCSSRSPRAAASPPRRTASACRAPA